MRSELNIYLLIREVCQTAFLSATVPGSFPEAKESTQKTWDG